MKSTTPVLYGALLLFTMVVWVEQPAEEKAFNPETYSSAADAGQGRLVLLVLDSLHEEFADGKRALPVLSRLGKRPDGAVIRVTTCSANYTLPCMQTLYEGRESPFSAGLHNFTGRAGGAASLPGIATTLGHRVILIGDHGLTTAYKGQAARVVNTDDWPKGYLKRDLRALDEGIKELRNPKTRMLLMITIGTDKASHQGGPSYRPHWETVDAKVGELVKELDLSKDTLIITGDHGHDKTGNHVPRSTVVLVGKRMTEILASIGERPKRLFQRDLLYFASYTLMLPLPPAYEGSFFPPAQKSLPKRLGQYRAIQKKVLSDQGFIGNTLAEQSAAVAKRQKEKQIEDLLDGLPLLFWYVAWLVWWRARPSMRSRLLITAIGGAGGLALSWMRAFHLGPYLAVPVVLLGLWPLAKRDTRRETALLWVLTGAAGIVGYLARPWKTFFHTTDDFGLGMFAGLHLPIILFFVSIPAVGALLSWLKTGSLRRMAHGSVLYGMFCLPSGVYYYHFGQNMFRGFILTAALVVLWQLVVPPRSTLGYLRGLGARALAFPLGLMAVTAVVIFAQESGGWEWSLYLTRNLKEIPPWISVVLFYAAALPFLALLDRTRDRIWLAAMWPVAHLYCTQVGQLPVFNLAATMFPYLFVLGWLQLRRGFGEGAAVESPADERQLDHDGLVIAAAFTCANWFLFDSFFLNQIDFSYAYDLFDWVTTERGFVLGTFITAMTKYGLPAFLFIFYLRIRSPKRFNTLFSIVFFYFHLKFVTLLSQIMFGMLAPGQKMFELAIMEIAFIWLMFVVTGAIQLGFTARLALGKKRG